MVERQPLVIRSKLLHTDFVGHLPTLLFSNLRIQYIFCFIKKCAMILIGIIPVLYQFYRSPAGTLSSWTPSCWQFEGEYWSFEVRRCTGWASYMPLEAHSSVSPFFSDSFALSICSSAPSSFTPCWPRPSPLSPVLHFQFLPSAVRAFHSKFYILFRSCSPLYWYHSIFSTEQYADSWGTPRPWRDSPDFSLDLRACHSA